MSDASTAPRLLADVRQDGSALLELDGQHRHLQPGSFDQTRAAIGGIAAEAARAYGHPMQVEISGADGSWDITVHGDGSVTDVRQPGERSTLIDSVPPSVGTPAPAFAPAAEPEGEGEQANRDGASTEQSSTEQISTEQIGTEQIGTEQASVEEIGTEQASAEETSAEPSFDDLLDSSTEDADQEIAAGTEVPAHPAVELAPTIEHEPAPAPVSSPSLPAQHLVPEADDSDEIDEDTVVRPRTPETPAPSPSLPLSQAPLSSVPVSQPPLSQPPVSQAPISSVPQSPALPVAEPPVAEPAAAPQASAPAAQQPAAQQSAAPQPAEQPAWESPAEQPIAQAPAGPQYGVPHAAQSYQQQQAAPPQHGQSQQGQPYAPTPAQAPAQDPYAQSPAAQDPYAQIPAAQDPYAQAAYAQDPYAQAPNAGFAAAQQQGVPAVYQPGAQPQAPAERQSFLRAEQREEPAQAGFRGMLSRAGLKVAPSSAEQAMRDAERAVSQHWPGPRTIAVVNGKGGAGKTPSTVMLSAVFAKYGGAGVLAWDNNQTRGTLGWRTERGPHESTLLELLPETERLLGPGAQAADLAHFVHHQAQDKYDVLRSKPMRLAHENRVSPDDVDAIHAVAAKFYRLIVIDSGNDESDPMWGRMIDLADQIVVATTTRADHAEAGALLLEALADRDERSARLARDSVVIVSQADRSATKADVDAVVGGYRALARDVERIPFDQSMVDGHLRLGALRPDARRAWLTAAAAVARGL